MILATNFKISHQYYRIEEGKLAEIIHSLVDIVVSKVLSSVMVVTKVRRFVGSHFGIEYRVRVGRKDRHSTFHILFRQSANLRTFVALLCH